MNNFITENTEFSDFYQFPKFLLTMPISCSAQLTYMLIYDQSRLSKKNKMTDQNGVYVIAPIKKLAKKLGKSQRMIQNILHELEENGLLLRTSGGFGRADHLHLLVPEAKNSSARKKVHTIPEKNCHQEENFSSSVTGSFLPPINNNINNNKLSNSERVRETHARKYGRYENIFLTPDQHDAFVHDYPKDAERLIEEMSTYCASEGKAYKSYDAALRSWAEREIKQKKADGTYDEYHYTYEPLDANAVMPWDLV